MINLISHVLVYSLAVIAGVVGVQTLFLMSQFLPESSGYMWRAANKIRTFLFGFLIFEFLASLFIMMLVVAIVPALYLKGFNFALIALVVAAPATLEQIFLPRNRMSVEKWRRWPSKVMLRFGLRYKFAWAIESCRQQDVFDSQDSGWGLGLAPLEISRRIRVLYETEKLEIAKGRDDPSLLAYDVNHNSWEKFYLLVRHMGRKNLRLWLENPPDLTSLEWNQSERRRVFGSSKDREPGPGSWTASKRIYDRIGSVLSETATHGDLVALAPEIAPEDLRSIEQARARYGELVDKEFAAKISKPEQVELAQLEVFLDQAEEYLYSPTIEKLKEIRNAITIGPSDKS